MGREVEINLSLEEHKIWAPEKKSFKYIKKKASRNGFYLMFFLERRYEMTISNSGSSH